jgi:uncharacterized protein
MPFYPVKLFLNLVSCFIVLFTVTACSTKESSPHTPSATAEPSQVPQITTYKEIEWPDLMPKEDLDALMNPPDYLDEISDGSSADKLDSNLKVNTTKTETPYQKALVSTRVIAEFNQQKIRIPGYIVPLEFNDQQIVTQFLLVPFFGACIHLPPPPPNQIILATFPKGVNAEDLSDAFFVEGTLQTELKENEMATSAYSMTVDNILPYEEKNIE